jgi:hypothetical protein
MRLLPLLFLLACGVSDALPRPQLAPPALALDALVPGLTTTLEVTGVAPGARVAVFVAGSDVGSPICPPQMGGLCLDLAQPGMRFGVALADASGRAQVTGRLPSGLPTGPVFAQAVSGDGFELSNVVTLELVSRNGDEDGDGVRNGREVRDGTNPLDADTDGDGCSDLVDPDALTVDDADADGICDAVDLCFGDNALGDPDNDGVCGASSCAGTVDDGVCFDPDPSGPVHETPAWIVRRFAGDPCDDGLLPGPAGDWQFGPVFADDALPTSVPLLDQFCRYAYVGAGPLPSLLVTGADTVVRERAVATLQAPPSKADVLDYQVGSFLAAVDAPAELPTLPGSTTLAVVDSSPTAGLPAALVEPGTEPHGLILANIAQTLVCPTGSGCAADVVTRDVFDATSLTDATAETGVSGELATLASIASGVYDETRASPGNLVLNLSLGWHPAFGGQADGDPTTGDPADHLDAVNALTSMTAPGQVDLWPVDVQAVFYALAYARCEGALAFAAAGNATGGRRGTTGMLLPGAWTQIPEPSLPTCGVFGSGAAPAGPLLHAVGGVGPAGGVAVSREDGVPFLNSEATAGFAPSVQYRRGNTLVDVASDPATALDDTVWPRSGTSISTVVVSSAASILWSAYPQWTRDQVVAMLWRAAEPARIDVTTRLSAPAWYPGDTPVPATHDLQAPNSPFAEASPPLRQSRFVSVCSALLTVAELHTGAQQDATDGPLFDVFDDVLRYCPAVAAGPRFSGGSTTTTVVHGAPFQSPACTGDRIFGNDTNGQRYHDDLCPERQYYTKEVRGGADPQPSSNQCPACFIDWDVGSVFIDIRDPSRVTRVGLSIPTPLETVKVLLPRRTPLVNATVSVPALLDLRDDGTALAATKGVNLVMRRTDGKLVMAPLTEVGDKSPQP